MRPRSGLVRTCSASRLDGTDYLAESNGAQWSVTASPSPAPADVTITATTQSLAALIFTGSDAGIDITGETGAAERFRRLIGTMAVVVQPVQSAVQHAAGHRGHHAPRQRHHRRVSAMVPV